METAIAILVTVMALMWSTDDKEDNNKEPTINIEVHINNDKIEKGKK